MFTTFKKWAKIVKLNKIDVWISTLSNFVAISCSLVEPIAFSCFINYATEHNAQLALLWLGINLLLVCLDNLSWHINYSNYTQLISKTYLALQKSIFENLLKEKSSDDNAPFTQVDTSQTNNPNQSKRENLSDLSYCKLSASNKSTFEYAVNNDIFGVSTFIDTLIMRCCGIVKMVIMLTIIFTYSFSVGSVIFITCVIGFALMILYGRQKSNASDKLLQDQIRLDEKSSEIESKSGIIKKYNLEIPVLFEQERRFKNYVNSYNNLTTKKSIKDNCLQIYWYAMLTAVIVIIFYEFNNLYIGLAVFLILIDYCTNFIKTTESVFNFKLEISDLKSKISRIEPYLTDEFYSLNSTHSYDFRDAYKSGSENVTLKGKFLENNKRLNDVSLKLGDIAILKNKENYNLFEKGNKQILANGKSVDIFNDENCTFVSYENEMFNDSIIKNLKVFCQDEEFIFNLLQNLGLEKYLASLSQKENENISDITDEDICFLFNLARAICTDKQIIFMQVELQMSKYSNEISQTIKGHSKDKIFVVGDFNKVLKCKKSKRCRIFE